MLRLEYTHKNGDFVLYEADRAPEMVFPLVNAAGMMSSVTSRLAGDCKTGQNSFLLPPASVETLHESRAGRNFFAVLENGALWSAAGNSAAQQASRFSEPEEVSVRGGLLWFEVCRQNDRLGLASSALVFVPAGEARTELMRVTLRNTGDKPLRLTPTAAFPLYGRSADNIRDHRHVTSLLNRLEVAECGLRLTPTMTFDERGHKPGNTVYTVFGRQDDGQAPVRFLGPVQDYVGSGSYDWPQALAQQAAWMAPGDRAEGYEMAAVLQFAPCELAPGQQKSWLIALGINDDGLRYLTPEAFEQALAQTQAHWQRVGAASFETGDHALDGWLRWVAVQPEIRRICGCSFLPHHDYGRGGRGWRDLWQDSLALILRDPAAVREDLVRYFAGVRADGTNATIIGSQPGAFIADRNNIVRVWMDHGFWPLVTVNAYIQQTGDLSILTEKQPWFRDRRKQRGEVLADQEPAGTALGRGTVLEHLLVQHVTACCDAGEHGCIRLRGADWNDALDMAAERGESVAFTAAYAGNLGVLADLCDALADAEVKSVPLNAYFCMLLEAPWEQRSEALRQYEAVCEDRSAVRKADCRWIAASLRKMGDRLIRHLREQEFTAQGWMNSYYDNNGQAVRPMMLTGQVFALMSGTADDSQALSIQKNADALLYDEKRGGYCLNENFGGDIPPLGRQFGFAYGHKENGAVFCHMTVMYAYALLSRGYRDAGMKALRGLIGQSMAAEISRVYPGIPEYFDPKGRGMYPYLTGAGSWLMLCLITLVFGVRGQNGDLLLAPCLTPEDFGGAETAVIRCYFAGRPCEVRYRRPSEKDWKTLRVVRARLNGKALDGPLVKRDALTMLDEINIDAELEGSD
ncbi:MAG: cellobiose phosphorylase [Clostridia bacterium]|nr:cellobiose phosphorylase [Clostridia bacterium]